MPNFLKDKKKPEGSTFEKPNAIFLDENNLESCDDENNKPLEGVSSSEIKPKTSILVKTWNMAKQLFNYATPKIMKPAEIVEKEDCSVLGLNENIILTETIEESDVSESEASQKKLQHLTVLENCEVVVYGCGWNGGENIDFATTGTNPLIMEEETAGLPFEKMPDGLKLRIIGTTITYILMEEMKGAGFISQDIIEELFKKFTCVSLTDACQTLNTTFKDFVDEHFASLFKNCYPHGLARLTVVDKPVHNNFDSFGPKAVSPPPALKAIESASSTPLIQDEQKSSNPPETSAAAPIIQEESAKSDQSPLTSSSQSYTTESDTEVQYEMVETANDVKVDDDHDMPSTPVATTAPSNTSLTDDSNEVPNLDDIPDLEEDVLDIVTQSVKEPKKEEPQAAEVKQKDEKQAVLLNVKTLDATDDEDDDTTVEEDDTKEKKGAELKKDSGQNKTSSVKVPAGEKKDELTQEVDPKFLPHLLLAESDEESNTSTGTTKVEAKKSEPAIKQPVHAQKQNSSNAKETADKKQNVGKPVKQNEATAAEKKSNVMHTRLLEMDSDADTEIEPPKVVKEAAKTQTTTTTASASSGSSTTLLQTSLLISTDSSSDDEEEKKQKVEPPKVDKSKANSTPAKKNVVVSKPEPVVQLSESKSSHRLLAPNLLDFDSEEDVKTNQKKKKSSKASSLTQKKTKEKKPPTSAASKEKTYIMDHGVLGDTSDENRSDGEEKDSENEGKKPLSSSLPGGAGTLPDNCLLSDGTDVSSADETAKKYSSSNKKVKSKSIETIKNIRLLNEKYIKRSESESEGEQFVSLEPPKSENVYRIDVDKKLVSIHDDGNNSSDESDEISSSEDEGPSSLEDTDSDETQSKETVDLESDMLDILDKQIADDFARKNAEIDLKAKEEEAKKNEEKLQQLATKKKEYDKEGSTENGVTRLENYLDNLIVDFEPAKIELPKKADVIVKKSKSPPEAVKPQLAKLPDIKLSSVKNEETTKVTESKKEIVKPKEVKAASIGKYDPSIPVVGEDYLHQITCSEEVVTVKKATPVKVAPNKSTSVQPSPAALVDDDFLNQIQPSVKNPVDKKSVPIIEDDFLELQNHVVQKPSDVVGDEFLNEICESSKPVSKQSASVVGDDFLDQIHETSVKKSAQIVGDDFLDQVEAPQNKPMAKKVAPIVGDDFLDQIGESKPTTKQSAHVVSDDFLDQIGESSASVPKQSAPIVNDDFLGQIETLQNKQMVKKPAPVVGDDFLKQIHGSNRAPIVGDDFLEQVEAHSVKKAAPIVGDDFLDKNGENRTTAKQSAHVVSDDFLDQIGESSASVPKQSAQIVGDDFLDQVETPYVKKSAPIVGDEFLNQIGENRTTAKHSASIVGDDFLDQVQAPQVKQVVKEAAPIVGDDFLDQIYSTQNKPMAAASVVGDDFLDQIHETSVKKAAPVVGDDFLDQITATQNKPMAKKPAPIVGDDFLEQVGRPTNDIVTVKNAKDSSSMPFGSAASKSSFVVPDDTLKKLIHSAEIGVNYDSESSESSASEKETINHKFAPLEYKIDQYLNVPNFAVVNDMKKQIAQSMPKPKLHHLLNFWLENFSGFPELVVFFQYLQYHIENFSLVDCLEFKKYRSLLNAVIRREPVFQSIEHLVANIPLMCKYKFLIYDDNCPDYIYVNPELLNLQMFPLASGLPSSVMYLFQRQRKWIISDLKKEFRDCSDTEFYRQLNNFLNDRPDLVMLESPKPKATLPQMSIVLNEQISVKLCCFMFSLKDLNVAEHLHLRMDYINSMKQFIPQRSKAR